MKGFNYLQLISIKKTIFNVPLLMFKTYFCSIIEKKNECLQILKFLRFKMICRLEKLVRGSNFVHKFDPYYKNGVIAISRRGNRQPGKRKGYLKKGKRKTKKEYSDSDTTDDGSDGDWD